MDDGWVDGSSHVCTDIVTCSGPLGTIHLPLELAVPGQEGFLSSPPPTLASRPTEQSRLLLEHPSLRLLPSPGPKSRTGVVGPRNRRIYQRGQFSFKLQKTLSHVTFIPVHANSRTCCEEKASDDT